MLKSADKIQATYVLFMFALAAGYVCEAAGI